MKQKNPVRIASKSDDRKQNTETHKMKASFVNSLKVNINENTKVEFNDNLDKTMKVENGTQTRKNKNSQRKFKTVNKSKIGNHDRKAKSFKKNSC